MPPKRPASSSFSPEARSATGVGNGDDNIKPESHSMDEEKPKIKTTGNKAPKNPKKAKGQAPRQWTAEEDAKFYAAIDKIVSEHLWGVLKEDPGLASRQNAGIKAHWKAAFKRLAAPKPS